MEGRNDASYYCARGTAQAPGEVAKCREDMNNSNDPVMMENIEPTSGFSTESSHDSLLPRLGASARDVGRHLNLPKRA